MGTTSTSKPWTGRPRTSQHLATRPCPSRDHNPTTTPLQHDYATTPLGLPIVISLVPHVVIPVEASSPRSAVRPSYVGKHVPAQPALTRLGPSLQPSLGPVLAPASLCPPSSSPVPCPVPVSSTVARASLRGSAHHGATQQACSVGPPSCTYCSPTQPTRPPHQGCQPHTQADHADMTRHRELRLNPTQAPRRATPAHRPVPAR